MPFEPVAFTDPADLPHQASDTGPGLSLVSFSRTYGVVRLCQGVRQA